MQPSYEWLVSIARSGHRVSPRGVTTFEVPYVQPIELKAGETVTRTNMNYKLAWLESLMYTAGVFDIDLIARVAPRSRLDLYQKQSDYGPRMAYQLARAADLLLTDRDTRRAVVLVDRPDDTGTDNETCATSLQFLIRENYLHTIVTMRSWDMCLGLPYDIITFGFLAQVMAAVVGTHPGQTALTCVPGSLHIYEENLEQVKTVRPGPSFYVRGFHQFQGKPWTLVQQHALTHLAMVDSWGHGTPMCVGIGPVRIIGQHEPVIRPLIGDDSSRYIPVGLTLDELTKKATGDKGANDAA